MLTILNPIKDPDLVEPRIVNDNAQAWKEWFQSEQEHFETSRQDWSNHWLHCKIEEAPLKKLAQKTKFIVSSESASERSLSRMAIIRSDRFRLHPKRCEHELILAFNSLPPPKTALGSQNLSQASAGCERDPDEESMMSLPTDNEDDAPIPKTKHRAEATPGAKSTIKEQEVEIIAEELNSDTVRALSPRYGSQVIMLWHWHSSQWLRFKKDHRRFVTGATIVKINRTTNVVYISHGRKLYKMDLATAFVRLLQIAVNSETLEWPNTAYCINVSSDNFTEVNQVDDDKEKEEGEEEDEKGFNEVPPLEFDDEDDIWGEESAANLEENAANADEKATNPDENADSVDNEGTMAANPGVTPDNDNPN